MANPGGVTLNRLVLTFGLGLLLAFAVTGAVSLFTFDRLIERDTRRDVKVEHQGLLEIYRTGGSAALSDTIDDRVNDPTNLQAVYLLVDRKGDVLAGHGDELPAPLWRARGWVRFPWHRQTDADEVLAFVQQLPDGELLVTGHTTGEQQHSRDLIVQLGGTSLALLSALTLLLSWLLGRGVDRALEAPLDTVDRVAAGHLHERVPERRSDDGFARLDRTLNRMLDRIHELVGGIQSSTDAIAHDLRTPLMRLKTRLELLRQATGEGENRIEVESAIAEADQLIATFNSLLRLARIESAEGAPTAIVPLDAVLADAVEMWLAVAETRQQTINASIAPATIAGDRDLLFQLLSNLFDNAIKYAPVGSRIDVALQTSAREVLLEIRDHGSGIPPEQHQRVFDRFVRLESHRGTPGSGLGLSVVRAIAVRHGAEIHVEDAAPGMRVRIRFLAMAE
jgi:signal transduction histidine kinase